MIFSPRSTTAGLKVPADSQLSPRGEMIGASDNRRISANIPGRSDCADKAPSKSSWTQTCLRVLLRIRIAHSTDSLTNKNGRADPLPFLKTCVLALLLVDGLFEFRPRCELRDFAGGNFDGSAGLRVAAIPRLPL